MKLRLDQKVPDEMLRRACRAHTLMLSVRRVPKRLNACDSCVCLCNTGLAPVRLHRARLLGRTGHADRFFDVFVGEQRRHGNSKRQENLTRPGRTV